MTDNAWELLKRSSSLQKKSLVAKLVLMGIAPSRTPIVEASEAHLTECVGV